MALVRNGKTLTSTARGSAISFSLHLLANTNFLALASNSNWSHQVSQQRDLYPRYRPRYKEAITSISGTFAVLRGELAKPLEWIVRTTDLDPHKVACA